MIEAITTSENVKKIPAEVLNIQGLDAENSNFTVKESICYTETMGEAIEPSNGIQELPDFEQRHYSYLCTLQHFSEKQIDQLRNIRQALILKQLDEELLQDEQTELEYLNWQIDRYEIAKDLEVIEQQESLISKNNAVVDAILQSFGISYGK